MKLYTILRNIVNGIKNAKAYTDTAEQNAKDYTDTSVSAITDNIKNLAIVKTQNIADINAGYNVNDAPRIMWFYTGGTAQFYISFDFYWIRLQFRSNATYMEARVIYGNSTGSWTRI